MIGLKVHKYERKNVNSIDLIYQKDGLEVNLYTIEDGTELLINPFDKKGEAYSIYYIIEGCLILNTTDGTLRLRTGDSFYIDDIEKPIIINCESFSKVLMYTTKSNYNQVSNALNALTSLVDLVEKKDKYTEGHSRRVAKYARLIAEELEFRDINIVKLNQAALLHDVGKCSISDLILKKNGKLNDDEYQIIKSHAKACEEILRAHGVKEDIIYIASHHHEKLDGSGYPDALKGDEITKETRIVTVADTFDAMTSKRSYKINKGYKEACAELEGMSHAYDYEVVLALKKLIYEKKI